MALFPERGADGGALFLHYRSLIRDGLRCSNIPDELFYYVRQSMRAEVLPVPYSYRNSSCCSLAPLRALKCWLSNQCGCAVIVFDYEVAGRLDIARAELKHDMRGKCYVSEMFCSLPRSGALMLFAG